LLPRRTKGGDIHVHNYFGVMLQSASDSHSEAGEVLPEMIPSRLWNIFPPNGKYLKNIMEFCGYQSSEAIVRLKNPDELQKMFDFVKEMTDIIDDKQEMFGIFAPKPEKVRVLPGLEVTFKKFISSVEAHRSTGSVAPIAASNSKKRKRSSVVTTSEDIMTQMMEWCSKRGFEGEDKFKIEKNALGVFEFTCVVCKMRINLTENKNCVSLLIPQKHVTKSCWMYEKKIKKSQKKIGSKLSFEDVIKEPLSPCPPSPPHAPSKSPKHEKRNTNMDISDDDDMHDDARSCGGDVSISSSVEVKEAKEEEMEAVQALMMKSEKGNDRDEMEKARHSAEENTE